MSGLIGTGGAAQYKSPKRFKTPKGRYWVGGVNPASRADRLDKPISNFASSEPEGRKMRTRRGVFYGFKWVCRAERNDLPLLLGNRSPRRTGGARAQRGNERRPSNSNVQAEVLGF